MRVLLPVLLLFIPMLVTLFFLWPFGSLVLLYMLLLLKLWVLAFTLDVC